MGLSTGIIGLPNVGKSTLFNAITNLNVEAANYPFATIEPNIGIVNLPDERIDIISDIVKPIKTTYALVKFVDIAGLVKGASKGEGLGNKFLQNIKDVDALIHVVRCFENDDITHVENSVNPLRDVQIINLELILSDLELVTNRIGRIEKTAKSGDKKAQYELNILIKLKECLEQEKLLNTLNLDAEELLTIKSFNFITLKPMMFVANISENDINNLQNNKHYLELENFCKNNDYNLIPISAKIEAEISQLDSNDKKIFLKDLGLNYSGLDLLIRSSFNLLNLATFFTVGKQEVRSWIFKKGWTAPECAGEIHTDFQKGFIKAEIIKYNDFIEYKNENTLKELGKIHLEGKNYIVEDGDICNFKFNVTK